MHLKDADRDYADLLFVRTRSGNPAQEQQARVELAAWSQADPIRRKYVEELTKADAFLAALPRMPLPHPRSKPVSRPSRRAVSWMAAASIVLAAGCAWIVNPELSSNTYVTAVGEQKNVVLPDGSTVALNTGTSLSFSLRLRSREASLTTGEALFDVQHSAVRPFNVATEQTRVKVVGTSFSVRNMDYGSRIEVLRGLVEVRPSAHAPARMLEAGEAIDTMRGTLSSDVHSVDVASISQWRAGRVAFDGVPLNTMLTELRRYRLAPIKLKDPSLGTLSFTGSFSTACPDQVLKLLPSLYKVRVTIQADGSAEIRRD